MKAIKMCWDIPGGTVDGNPLANEGDMGSIPGPGRFHMVWSCWGCTPQLLSSHALEPERYNYWAHVLNYWAHVPRACPPQQEKPLQWKAYEKPEE